MRKTFLLTMSFLLLSFFIATSFADEVTIFENQYLRTEGDPDYYSAMFSAPKAGEGKLIVRNGNYDGEGVSGGVNMS